MIDHHGLLRLIRRAAGAVLLGVLYPVQRRTSDATAVDAGLAFSLVIAALHAVLGPGRALGRADHGPAPRPSSAACAVL